MGTDHYRLPQLGTNHLDPLYVMLIAADVTDGA